MSEHLLKAGANITPREGDELARLPYLRTWFRTRSAIILHLSNGSVQINFFQVNRGGEELGRLPLPGSRPPGLGGEGTVWDPSLASGSRKRGGRGNGNPSSAKMSPLHSPTHTSSWGLQSAHNSPSVSLPSFAS